MKTPQIIYEKNKIIIFEKQISTSLLHEDIYAMIYESPYIFIYVKGKSPVRLFSSLAKVLSRLGDSFILCNRSTVVNLIHVDIFDQEKREISLKNNQSYSVSCRKVNQFGEALQKILDDLGSD